MKNSLLNPEIYLLLLLAAIKTTMQQPLLWFMLQFSDTLSVNTFDSEAFMQLGSAQHPPPRCVGSEVNLRGCPEAPSVVNGAWQVHSEGDSH